MKNIFFLTHNTIIYITKISVFGIKAIFLFSMFFFFSMNSYSLSDIFLRYCKYINNAELNIIDNNLEKALFYYDSAFSLYQRPLAKDIHNAIVCSKKINKKNKIKQYLDLMIFTKNLDPKYYKRERLIKYISNEELNKIKNQYIEKTQREEYLFIKQIVQDDRAIRTNENYRQHTYLIREVDSLNFEKYKTYFENSFPGEHLTLDFPCQNKIDYILFRHWFQCKFDVIGMAKILVEDLKYLNIDFAYQHETMNGTFFQRNGYGLILKRIEQGKAIVITFSQEDINEINKKRAKIGLESYNEYVKKVDFFSKHKEYCYKINYYKFYIG